MGNYLKKVIILKGNNESENLFKGSVKLVSENNKNSMCVELVKMPNNRTIPLNWCICGDNKIATGELPLNHKFTVNLDDDFYFLEGAFFCIYDENSLGFLSYGLFGEPAYSLEDIKGYLVDKKTNQTAVENFCYDDEIIATENYYGKEYDELLRNQTFNFKNCEEEENSKTQNANQLYSDETCACTQKEFGYYERIKDKLNELLLKNPPLKELNEIIKDGYFVKISYDNTRHYTVGKIIKNGIVKYVCYGVPGVYLNMPSGLNENYKFVPTSLFEPTSNGYYIIFQNANTSEIL